MFLLRKYKTAIFIVTLLLLALILFFYNLKQGVDGSFFRKIVLETVAPAQKVLSASVKSVNDAWLRYVLLVGIQEENKNLKNKINELKAALILYQEGYLEAQRLKKASRP